MKHSRWVSILKILLSVVLSAFVLFGTLLFFSALWYIRNYGDTGFDSVLFTLLSNMGGVSEGLLASYLLGSVLPTVLLCAALIFLIYFLRIPNVKYWHRNIFSGFLAFLFIFLAGTKMNLQGYIRRMMTKSTIYEEYYVEPTKDIITFPKDKRNLIYIFLESIESTYLSKDEGGALNINIMPELTKLAEDNINFSHNSGVGGFLTPEGTGWTVAGMVSQTSGVPLRGSSGTLANNEYGKEEFLPGVTTLSDILSENGYNQALMVGSLASFANRDVFFRNHKTDYIYDLNSAKEDGIVDEDYYVWWGMEDHYLFSYAKNKIREFSRQKEPFAFTLLTVDTHFKDGYVCKLCRNNHDEQYENVIACASRQVNDFIKWIKRQSFYKDTTIVICGDHLTMDYQYIKRNVPEDFDRRVYNCIINSAVTGENYKNRTFTTLDLFPTTLAAMGCEIDGERLGLGTNLFSEKETIAEEMSYEKFQHQILFSSNYYVKNFMIDKEE